MISSLFDFNGLRLDWNSGLKDHITNYFSALFKSNGCNDSYIAQMVSPRVSDCQNMELVKPFSALEIIEAVKAMHPDKSPGPDGFNPGFFQQHWDIIGTFVTTFCLEDRKSVV